MLTTAQRTTLRTYLSTAKASDATLAGILLTGQAPALAAWLNQDKANYIVWKTNVKITVIGDNINGTELAGLTSLNNTRLQTICLFSEDGVNPSLADRRQFFDDIFSGSGGTITRANLLALWKRTARQVEAALATGTGTDASPAKMTWEGAITEQDAALVLFDDNGVRQTF